MSYKGKKILAVIPARGGSIGIKKKNLRKLFDKSLIQMAAEVANSVKWIDCAMISSDNKEIIDEGIKYGLMAPFVRPVELSTSTALSYDVWIHAWKETEQYLNKDFDISILLEPTSPLRTANDIEKVIRKVIDNNYPAVATFSKVPAHFTPEKTLLTNKSGTISFYHHDGGKYSLRQKIPTYLHRNGICYAVTKECLFKYKSIIEKNCYPHIIERPTVNIDEPFELELAEWLLKKIQNNS